MEGWIDKVIDKTACGAVLPLAQFSPLFSPPFSDPLSPLLFDQNHPLRFIQTMMPVARAAMEPSARK